MELNEITSRLPPHLMQFVIEQPYYNYTPVDQAVWRYVMRKNLHHLRTVAHNSYVDGLKITGIDIDRIPTLYGMNRILKTIGWAAVAVDGFIPPAAFMEFQAYKVLVIAADIRTLAHIEYTPAPDILHEAAGHAPIIADPEYADFLIYFGKIGCKAFPSQQDHELYEAIRHLSIIKEDPNTSDEEIDEGEKRIAHIQANMGEPSEMALLRNLHWWSVEYGLIGTLDDYKLYGAGLLSSIGESVSCMRPEVKKLPYTIDTARFTYDITKPQPQLFVTPNFPHLRKVLDQFVQTMAISKGGLEAVQKAIRCASVSTCVLSSGIQITGVFDAVSSDEKKQYPICIATSGPTSFSLENKELSHFPKEHHPSGYLVPIGRWKGQATEPENLTDTNLNSMGIIIGHQCTVVYESGFSVKGKLISIHRNAIDGKLLLLEFKNGCVKHGNKIVHDFSNESYALVVGGFVSSAFFGPADIKAYQPTSKVSREKMHKIQYDTSTVRLHTLYQKVREVREQRAEFAMLPKIWNMVCHYFPNEWLLPLELYELMRNENGYKKTAELIRNELTDKIKTHPHLKHLIEDGLELLDK